jgi:hypothetical protein
MTKQNLWMRMVCIFAGGFVASSSAVVQAGIPECGNMRLEDALSCEVRGDLSCSASCSELGVYKKACATRLQTVCSNTCTLSAEATCTDSCTESCTETCDRGENVICTHNCFRECTVPCAAHCENAVDKEQCHATCEANCDAECDIKCKPLVDGDCYKHCIECCGGACTADANMDCQQTCQVQEFEDCEYEFRADCDGSCEGSGALFCDDEFVLAGEAIPTCVKALASAGIADIEAEIGVTIGDGVGAIDEAKGRASPKCSFDPRPRSSGPAWLLLSAGIVVSVARRRSRRRM